VVHTFSPLGIATSHSLMLEVKVDLKSSGDFELGERL
jgi:hypothetical protein